MSHLVLRLVLADLRAAPGRAVAVAVLLASACLLPTLVSAAPGVGAVLAVAVAVAATIGAMGAHRRRSAVLLLNGARPAVVEGILAAATIVVPGAGAAVLAAAVGAVLSPGPALASVVLLALVVPVVAAPPAAWLVRRDADVAALPPAPARPGTGAAGTRRRGRRIVRVLALAVFALLVPVLFLPWLALHLSSPRRVHGALCRAAAVAVALVMVVGTAVLAGWSEDWFTLGVVLLVFGPGAAVGVAVLGSAVLDAVGRAAAGAGPWARLALGPVTGRSRALGPVVGILAVVTSLAAMDATVGASFGRREADHERTIPTVTAAAGTSPDQAIADVRAVDPAALRRIADEVTAASGTRAVVIGRHGVGTTRTYAGREFLSLAEPPTTYLGTDQFAEAPIWLGVVDPAELGLLGLAGSAADLAAGKVVLLAPSVGGPAGTVTVSRPDGTTSLPAAPAVGPAGGVELPAGLASPATAASIEGPVSTARVVVVPEPGTRVEPETLRASAQAIVDRARDLPLVEPVDPAHHGLDLEVVDALSRATSGRVLLGDERVVTFRSGPLNDLPVLSGTEDEGRGRLAGLGALALLVTVAGVGLALGATRTEQAVLGAQGAPPALRPTVGAIQAAVLAGSSSLLAALVGIGLPALAFRLYDAGADLPAIPLVVPGEVVALLVGLPLVAAGLTALLGLRPGERDPAGSVPGDGLAW